jgi:hypothetical protein
MKILSLIGVIALGLLTVQNSFAADCVNGVNFASCTVPPGVNSVLVEVWGAGAGGSRGSDGTGGGGGGGSYCAARFSVTPGSPLTLTIGVGGAGGYPGDDGGFSAVVGGGIVGIQADGGRSEFEPTDRRFNHMRPSIAPRMRPQSA